MTILNKRLDEEYRSLALTALHEGLLKQEMPEKSACTKEELLDAFEYSGSILRANHPEEQVRMMADCVFETCIRLARCLFFPQEARLIVLQGKEYSLDAQSQTDTLRRDMSELKRIAEG